MVTHSEGAGCREFERSTIARLARLPEVYGRHTSRAPNFQAQKDPSSKFIARAGSRHGVGRFQPLVAMVTVKNSGNPRHDY